MLRTSGKRSKNSLFTGSLFKSNNESLFKTHKRTGKTGRSLLSGQSKRSGKR